MLSVLNLEHISILRFLEAKKNGEQVLSINPSPVCLLFMTLHYRGPDNYSVWLQGISIVCIYDKGLIKYICIGLYILTSQGSETVISRSGGLKGRTYFNFKC